MSEATQRPWFNRFFGEEENEASSKQAESNAEWLRQVQNAAPFIDEFKQRLRRRSTETKWRPGMNQEEAAQNLIAQTIYLEIIDELERMMRAATEHLQ